ncbi:unnamed protein product, partial [Brassica napus]
MGLNVTHKKSRTKSYAVETEIRRSSDSELELSHEVHQRPSDKDENVKLKQLQYLLLKVLPVLRDICAEQNRELEVETAVRGI